jgi:L-ascorbate metabolism protein UlaG (beta-lactamase superfamily)
MAKMKSHILVSFLLSSIALGLAVGAGGCGERAAAPATNPVSNSSAAVVEPPPMTSSGSTLTWFGHAAFKLVTPTGKVIFFDPWITNPKNPTGKDDLAKIDKADLILVSHGHADHVGDAVAIGKKTGAKLVTTFDLGASLVAYQGYPAEGVGFESQGNFGGEISLLGGDVSVLFVPAVHGSTVTRPDNKPDDARPGGNPGGFVVSVKNGPVVYHTGDTDVYSDMAQIPRSHRVNVMLACIGDHFTMGPERAARAVALVAPTVVVPMHFGTFPVLTGTPDGFDAAVKKQGLRSQVKVLQIKEEMKL